MDCLICQKWFEIGIRHRHGIRHRGMNQYHHIFASRLLTTGKYPEKWIANYLGHTSTAMLHKHYGKFIEADSPDLEKQASEDLSLTRTIAGTRGSNDNKEPHNIEESKGGSFNPKSKTVKKYP